MNKYQKSSELKCNVVTSPSTRPQMSRRLTQLSQIVTRRREAVEKFEAVSRDTTVYRMGEPHTDLQLTCKGFSEDDGKFLDEIEARGLEAYIYSAVPGALLQACPLTRGIKGDPEDGTYTAAVASGTKVYLPSPDNTTTVYMEETDFENTPILAQGISFADNTLQPTVLSKELPLGRGVIIPSIAKNGIKNSLFLATGGSVSNWTHSNGEGDNFLRTGWMGVSSLFLWDTTHTWLSDSISITAMVDGDKLALSFGWKTNGTLRWTAKWNNGALNATSTGTVADGSGYKQVTLIVPVGYGGVGGNVALQFDLTSGLFGEFCAPQIIMGNTADGGCAEYPLFLGAGIDEQGEITACNLEYTGMWQAGMWRTVANASDSVICVSGFVQPMLDADNWLPVSKMFSLSDWKNKDIECHLRTSGSDLKIYLRADGIAYGNVLITGYERGDVLFVAMMVGWTAGVSHKRLVVRAVGGNTSYVVEDTTGVDAFTAYDTLHIGTNELGAEGCNCIFQDANIWVGTEAMVDNQVAYMTDEDNLMEHRETCGKLYHIENHLNPDPYNRQILDGTITCLNTKVL